MLAPPRKRQKRLVVPASSPEHERPASRTRKAEKESEPSAEEITKLSLPSRTRPRRSHTTAKHDDPPASPPRKSRPRKTKDQGAPTSRPLPTFFTASIERQRSIGEQEEADVEEIEDTIQDSAFAHQDLYAGPSRTKRGRDAAGPLEPVTETREKGTSRGSSRSHGSQRFHFDAGPAKPRGGDATSAPPGRPELEDSRPWVDKYAPTTLDEIAVHPKKVDDVRRWIVDAFAGRSQKVGYFKVHSRPSRYALSLVDSTVHADAS